MATRPQRPKPFDGNPPLQLTHIKMKSGCPTWGDVNIPKTTTRRLVRRTAKPSYRALANFVCSGAIDCGCDGCNYEAPATDQRALPKIKCDVCRYRKGHEHIMRMIDVWAHELRTLEAVTNKIAIVTGTDYHRRCIMMIQLAQLLRHTAYCVCGTAGIHPYVCSGVASTKIGQCHCGAWSRYVAAKK